MKKLICKSNKIFLAGGNGMVGSAIKKKLIEHNYGKFEHDGLILNPSRKELNLTDSIAVKLWMKKNKPDIVIIAAAKVGGIMANSKYPVDFLLDNLKIQTNVIEAAWLCGVKRLLFLGSSCIYPNNYQEPIKEEFLLSGPLEKTNEYYAIAKISGIKLCDSLRYQYDFDAISLMPTNLYGPKDNYHINDSHVMAALIRKFMHAKKYNLTSVKCWGTGFPKREFLYVDDLAEAAIFCLENWDPYSKSSPKDLFGKPLTLLNIGTGIDISIKKLAELISNIVGFDGEIVWDNSKPDGTRRKLLDVKRISELGWKAEVDLEQGIKNTIRDLKLNKEKYDFL